MLHSNTNSKTKQVTATSLIQKFILNTCCVLLEGPQYWRKLNYTIEWIWSLFPKPVDLSVWKPGVSTNILKVLKILIHQTWLDRPIPFIVVVFLARELTTVYEVCLKPSTYLQHLVGIEHITMDVFWKKFIGLS